jgi:flavin reductase (DIM6/NTAB) family NADH-FMN oxidoreductase RutF
VSGEPGAILDGGVLRRAFSCFPSGVTALCGLVEGRPVGMAVSSFTSVSLDPPLALVCVAHTSSTWEQLASLDRLGVSVLGSSHDVSCRALSSKDVDRFGSIDWRSTDRGAVVIDGATAWLDCEVEEIHEAGDHKIVLLRIHDLDADLEVDPLVFHGSRFRALHTAEPEPRADR